MAKLVHVAPDIITLYIDFADSCCNLGDLSIRYAEFNILSYPANALAVV